MAELHIRIFLGSLLHEGLMAEGVGKDDLAALVLRQVDRRVIAGVVFADAGHDDDLLVLQTEAFLDALERRDEVVVIGRVFVVQADHADLEVVRDLHVGRDSVARQNVSAFALLRRRGSARIAVAASGKRQYHQHCQCDCQDLFHVSFPPNLYSREQLVRSYRKKEDSAQQKVTPSFTSIDAMRAKDSTRIPCSRTRVAPF